MRELNLSEMHLVAGGVGQCTPEDAGGNEYGGVKDVSTVGDELIALYEGVVQATSHIIERVANAL